MAAGAAQEPGTATPADSARMIDEAFERWERDHGLNVLQFPERGRAARREGPPGE